MTAEATGPKNPLQSVTVDLDVAIKRGDQEIEKLLLRRPMGGALRGLKLLDLMQLDVVTLETILPRISTPAITQAEAQGLDPADKLACATEVAGFFLTKAQLAAFQET